MIAGRVPCGGLSLPVEVSVMLDLGDATPGEVRPSPLHWVGCLQDASPLSLPGLVGPGHHNRKARAQVLEPWKHFGNNRYAGYRASKASLLVHILGNSITAACLAHGCPMGEINSCKKKKHIYRSSSIFRKRCLVVKSSTWGFLVAQW